MDALELATLLSAKRRELELERRKAELLRTNGLAFYRPHPKQSLFHANADKKYRYARTGNRFGKSEMGSAEDVAFAFGERTWLDKGDPLRTVGIPARPTKGLIITVDWEKSTEVFTNRDGSAELGKLFRFIPTEALGNVTKNHSGAIDKIIVKRPQGMGESIIQIDTVKSFASNPMGQESAVFDWIHVDEPCPKPMFIANARGLMDRGGKVWFTCTPLTELWINDMFVPNRHIQLTSDILVNAAEKKFMMIGSTYDNPYINPEDIKDFENTLTKDEIQCRINGIPLALAGLVYKEFKPDLHVYNATPPGWKSMNVPPLDYTIRYAIDPHNKKPTAVQFIATSPLGQSFVYDEIWEESLIPEVIDSIKQRLVGRDAQDALIDPFAKTPDPVHGGCMMDEFIANDLVVMEAVKNPGFGIMKVKDFLRSRDLKGGPTLMVSADCTRTLWEFDHFLWDPKTGKPVKENDDMLECLYRLCLTGLEYVPPTNDKDYARIGNMPISDVVLTRADLELNLGDGYKSTAAKPLYQRLRSKRRSHSNDIY